MPEDKKIGVLEEILSEIKSFNAGEMDDAIDGNKFPENNTVLIGVRTTPEGEVPIVFSLFNGNAERMLEILSVVMSMMSAHIDQVAKSVHPDDEFAQKMFHVQCAVRAAAKSAAARTLLNDSDAKKIERVFRPEDQFPLRGGNA